MVESRKSAAVVVPWLPNALCRSNSRDEMLELQLSPESFKFVTPAAAWGIDWYVFEFTDAYLFGDIRVDRYDGSDEYAPGGEPTDSL
jgi:hypothetical protein